jgi:hypothetical protein
MKLAVFASLLLLSLAVNGQDTTTVESLPHWEYVHNDTAILTVFKGQIIGYNKTRSKYKPGFKFWTPDGCHATLVKWMFDGMQYRWKTLYEKNGVSAIGWTDDRVIESYVNTNSSSHMKKRD